MSQVITDAEKAAYLDCTIELLDCVKEGALSMSEVLAGLRKLIDGDEDGTTVNLNADPLIPEGLSVKEHWRGGRLAFDPDQTDLYLSDEQGVEEGGVAGTQLREELKDQRVFNANLLDWLLLPENQRLIPEEWKDKKVFFWGTIYCEDGEYLVVRYLCCRKGIWHSDERYLEEIWGPNDASVVSAS
jgi:hypothetical protein